MTLSELKACTRKELAELAKRHRVDGWHPMRKDELIKALAAATRGKKSGATARSSRTPAGRKSGGQRQSRPTASNSSRAGRSLVAKANAPARSRAQKARAQAQSGGGRKSSRKPTTVANRRTIDVAQRDRIDVHVCDPYWLNVEWEISRDMVSRAEAALRSEWHTAQPVIRLFDVTSDDSAALLKTRVRDVRIRGDVNSWFVEIENPERAFKLHLGYLTTSGRFFVVARSRKVCTSSPGRNGQRWNGHQGRPDQAYESLHGETSARRKFLGDLTTGPVTSPGLFKFGNDSSGGPSSDFEFRLDAELIVSGATQPGAELSLLGNPVTLDADGTFSVRFALPNGRQVIPAVATSPDNTEQHTIVLAIERNTKELEPHVFDDSPL